MKQLSSIIRPTALWVAGIFFLSASLASAQSAIPLVYDVENTGASFAEPAYPAQDQLPFIQQLPDPLMFSDGSGRATDFKDWSRRRSEIANEIQHYEIGRKPAVSRESIDAKMDGDTLIVSVTVNGKTLRMKTLIMYPPTGQAPYPLMIGMNSIGGSIHKDVFAGMGIAHLVFWSGQVNGYSQFGGNDSREFERLYPELKGNGAYSEWAWGVSRLIDALQLLGPEKTRIDTRHIGVTGCSYAGKMALFCGAFDERIALVVSQEPGGGGAAAWRVSQWMPEKVEHIDNTDYNWFMPSLKEQFGDDNVSYLPYDHHELIALCCPRACLILGNPDYEWLADPSAYVSCNAAKKVWQQFGIADRFGYSIVAGHGHCQLPQSQFPEVKAFISRFLLGQDDVSTDNVAIAPQHFIEKYDCKKWTKWWGTNQQPPIRLQP